MSKELEDHLYTSILSDLERGDISSEKSHNATALKYYLSALEKVPDPKTDWEIALHIYTAMGDLFINMTEYENAIYHYNQALQCPDGVTTGYVWLGLGQAYFEENKIEKAKDALMSAYMLEGKDIFNDEDIKYFDLIKNEINR